MKPNIVTHILDTLKDCGGIRLSHDILIDQVQLTMVPCPSRDEITESVEWCERQGYIVGSTNEITRVRSWKITQDGAVAGK